MGQHNLIKCNFLIPETTKPLDVHTACLGLLAVSEAWLTGAGRVESKGVWQPWGRSQSSGHLYGEPRAHFRKAGGIKVQLCHQRETGLQSALSWIFPGML